MGAFPGFVDIESIIEYRMSTTLKAAFILELSTFMYHKSTVA